jgi:zinc protease
MYCILRCLFAFFFFTACSAYAAQVHEYQLNNGLKLLVKEDHRAPVVVSQVWYKVGSSYEPRGITGISHALEHMMFRGSKHYGPGEFSRIIADNGGEQNAFTSYDYTAYYELLSADKLPIAFQLEADRMHHLLLREQDFKNEIQVVMEERRMRTEDNPQALTFERFMAVAHIANP